MILANDAEFPRLRRRNKAMNRKISAKLIAGTLALSLLGATAASADPWRHGGYRGGHDRGWHGRGDNTGALIGLGIGLFALGAIAASSHNDRYYDRYDYGPPPPPPPPPYYGPRGYYGYGY
jgi:hypothetical protein